MENKTNVECEVVGCVKPNECGVCGKCQKHHDEEIGEGNSSSFEDEGIKGEISPSDSQFVEMELYPSDSEKVVLFEGHLGWWNR